MTDFLDLALSCARRGWYVFPCNGKVPIEEGGYKTASVEDSKVREWWAKHPRANVAVAPGASHITVLDIDSGLTDEASLREFCARYSIPETFAVRTGKRPQYRVQLYFSGNADSLNGWKVDEFGGDVRGSWGHAMAAGSIHPESGAAYEMLWDKPLAPVPAWVRGLQAQRKERGIDPLAPIVEWRNDTLYRVLCKHRANGADDEMIRDFALRAQARMPNPLDEQELERVIANACLKPIGQPEPVPVLGASKLSITAEPVKDWREKYHTFAEMSAAPEPTFIIEGFIQKDVISAIAAPVGQRKTIIAANVVHSSITGEPLFGYFPVRERPARVLYLCPEMGLYQFAKRIRNLDLMQYVGKTLFCRTMNSQGRMSLGDLTREELTGALIVVDTAVRFVEGDENSSEDMKIFAEACFRLMRDGAASVIVLFHSPKGTKDASELTLENAMRGSGDLGAFVSSCWATRLQDSEAGWESPSYLKNVKQRDFESDPFEVKSDKCGRLFMVTKPGTAVKLNSKPSGVKADADGKEAEALQTIRDNPTLSDRNLSHLLKDKGIARGPSWVGNKRRDLGLRRTGVTLTTSL